MEFFNNPQRKELIEYLPFFLQKYYEFDEILKIETNLIHDSKTSSRELFSNNFMFKTSLTGIEFWEKMMGISVDKSLELEKRQMTVFLKWNRNNVYTMNWLREFLKSYFMNVNTIATPILYNNEYHLNIELSCEILTELELSLCKVLAPYIPANLTLILTEIIEKNNSLFFKNYNELEVDKELFMDSGVNLFSNNLNYTIFLEKEMEVLNGI